jgi:hypothetical protein
MTDLENPRVVPAPTIPTSPFQGDIMPPTLGAPLPDPDPAPAPEAAPAAKYIVGDREFRTQEEAIAYADGFVQSQSRVAQTMTPVATPQPAAQPKKLGTMLFEDPDATLDELERRILGKVNAQQGAVAQTKNFWDDFYLKHPDLKGSELLVDAVLAKEQSSGNFNTLSIQQAAPILAARARQEVSKIRNVPSGGQPLQSNPAVVAGSNGTSTPRPKHPRLQRLRILSLSFGA